ncbi:hypothetical protein CYLTODRAFT_495553 [Cylindrobasidium torrendii FP15055 ss-10]|uniref:BHLH domain-containing protein n=1 Tax=Cylindrobasidium torrendii FP15055 ss-10 TaxID=1314674 RepID=A0A0D7AR32_9AGAR|nr:hypothetical protein CYLTODRAFT_495553 [Cylindrobasidium torrendii FP15055 ss-10]
MNVGRDANGYWGEQRCCAPIADAVSRMRTFCTLATVRLPTFATNRLHRLRRHLLVDVDVDAVSAARISTDDDDMGRIEAEQRRRDELCDGYAKLKDVLPVSNQKSSKVSLLDRGAVSGMRRTVLEVVFGHESTRFRMRAKGRSLAALLVPALPFAADLARPWAEMKYTCGNYGRRNCPLRRTAANASGIEENSIQIVIEETESNTGAMGCKQNGASLPTHEDGTISHSHSPFLPSREYGPSLRRLPPSAHEGRAPNADPDRTKMSTRESTSSSPRECALAHSRVEERLREYILQLH